ncbi:MAG: hypothetical protein CMH64_01230 [Nanoarchaeota archaeon]|nr:hypothetical protein [Nanoarchaeota archaeon]|tara:strand:- start:438 stop:692 length:255 start_codon:yes stop_codon:yes gene_type:complete
MGQEHYMALAIALNGATGSGELYGVVLPYDPENAEDQRDMDEFRSMVGLRKLTIPYDGPDRSEAKHSVGNQKSIRQLVLDITSD